MQGAASLVITVLYKVALLIILNTSSTLCFPELPLQERKIPLAPLFLSNLPLLQATKHISLLPRNPPYQCLYLSQASWQISPTSPPSFST